MRERIIVKFDEAMQHIKAGTVPDGMFAQGTLDFSGDETLTALPAGLAGAWTIKLENCTALETLPDNLEFNRLNLNGCKSLRQLPRGLRCYELLARGAGLESVPDDLKVDFKIDFSECRDLETLPDGLKTGSLVLQNCIALHSLPDGLHLYFLDASGCTKLERWGNTGTIKVGVINLSNCIRLTYLPDWFGTISQLNISNCENLRELPANLEVTSTIELAGSGLSSIPEPSKKATLRWRDVEVDERIAFQPESITTEEIFKENNIELRRVKMERMGYDRFFKEAKAEELDQDVDPGGVRRLLKVEFNDGNRWQRDEPVVVLAVSCPSTARNYIIRVPPSVTTCHQAAAWVAGFDDPALYKPVQET